MVRFPVPRIAVFALLVAATALASFLGSGGAGPAGGASALSLVAPPPGGRAIEAVFVLDTTGSMSGLLEGAKRKIWSIADAMGGAQSGVPVRLGLVAYRDRGDAYVTKVVDLNRDLDSMYVKLMDFAADGGGDGPEAVNQALDAAINRMSWSQDRGTYKVVFLVGDAPPHMDYQDDVKYQQVVAAAAARGIVVNTIQCGTLSDTVAPSSARVRRHRESADENRRRRHARQSGSRSSARAFVGAVPGHAERVTSCRRPRRRLLEPRPPE